MNFDEEVKLYTTNAERERIENFATLYSIVVSLEYLERAFVRDSVTGREYAPACIRLLAQYKSLIKLLETDSNYASSSNNTKEAFSIESFMSRYNLSHPAALHRLLVGVPATVEHNAQDNSEGDGGSGKWVAETTQSFITLMDALKLNLRAKDQLHPILSDLISSGYANGRAVNGRSLNEGKGKLVGWLIELNGMKASGEITEEQSRQMLFDIEYAYNEFFRSLSSGANSGGGGDNGKEV